MDAVEMMRSMSMGSVPTGIDVEMVLVRECAMSMNACQVACRMCAGEDLGTAGMGRCAARCMSTAEMCQAGMGMLLRPIGYDTNAMTSMLVACVAMGRACLAECAVGTADCCGQCATACTDMVAKCEALLASMA